MAHPLGRIAPPDDKHVRLFGLSDKTMPTSPTPVVLGIAWYSGFDRPLYRQGAYWIGVGTNWGQVRGGHAICAKPPALTDVNGAYRFYDQGTEGACVGFSSSRMMTTLNSRFYDAMQLYNEARKIDGIKGPHDGTTVRAAMDILRQRGHWRRDQQATTGPFLEDGIKVNRWATSVSEIVQCLKQPSTQQYIVLMNSWGNGYPQYVRLPLEGLARLLREDGEATIVTDR